MPLFFLLCWLFPFPLPKANGFLSRVIFRSPPCAFRAFFYVHSPSSPSASAFSGVPFLFLTYGSHGFPFSSLPGLILFSVSHLTKIFFPFSDTHLASPFVPFSAVPPSRFRTYPKGVLSLKKQTAVSLPGNYSSSIALPFSFFSI